jgi:hypothetical protein
LIGEFDEPTAVNLRAAFRKENLVGALSDAFNIPRSVGRQKRDNVAFVEGGFVEDVIDDVHII